MVLNLVGLPSDIAGDVWRERGRVDVAELQIAEELFLFGLSDRWVELGAPNVIGPIRCVLDLPVRFVDCLDPFASSFEGVELFSSVLNRRS